jgi:hypothetical protein
MTRRGWDVLCPEGGYSTQPRVATLGTSKKNGSALKGAADRHRRNRHIMCGDPVQLRSMDRRWVGFSLVTGLKGRQKSCYAELPVSVPFTS